MKIAIITPVFPPYLAGIGNVAGQEAKGLAQRGLAVTVFTPWYPDRECLEMSLPYQVRRLWPNASHGNAAWIRKMSAELASFDIIHLHYPFIGAIGAVLKAARTSKARLIVTYHMDLVGRGWKGLFFKIYTHLTLPKIIKAADKILVSSLDYAQHSFLAPYLKKEPEKFVEVPFGVTLCHPEERSDEGSRSFATLSSAQDDTLKTILFVGALDRAHYFKGVDVLLDAMKDLEYKLMIVGDGDLRPYYEKKAKRLGIWNRVVFAGRVSDENLSKFYQQADVFVLPSIDKSEAYGMVLLEAMANSLPIVASNLPGVRGLIGEDRGLLVVPGNARELARALSDILSNNDKRRAMGATAKKWVEENRTVEKEIGKLLDVYKISCR